MSFKFLWRPTENLTKYRNSNRFHTGCICKTGLTRNHCFVFHSQKSILFFHQETCQNSTTASTVRPPNARSLQPRQCRSIPGLSNKAHTRVRTLVWKTKVGIVTILYFFRAECEKIQKTQDNSKSVGSVLGRKTG